MPRYVPPHLRQSSSIVCYSSTEAFYNGKGGFRTTPTSVQTMLASPTPYKAIVQAKLKTIWCCKAECIDGCHWTVNGIHIFAIFERLTTMFATGRMPGNVQGIKLLPRGRFYKVQIWCEDTDTESISHMLETALKEYRFDAKCILNRNWNKAQHEYLCDSIKEIHNN